MPPARLRRQRDQLAQQRQKRRVKGASGGVEPVRPAEAAELLQLDALTGVVLPHDARAPELHPLAVGQQGPTGPPLLIDLQGEKQRGQPRGGQLVGLGDHVQIGDHRPELGRPRPAKVPLYGLGAAQLREVLASGRRRELPPTDERRQRARHRRPAARECAAAARVWPPDAGASAAAGRKRSSAHPAAAVVAEHDHLRRPRRRGEERPRHDQHDEHTAPAHAPDASFIAHRWHARHASFRRGAAFLAVVAAAALLAACGGSSSGDARSLLSQTFSGKHTVNSGQLQFSVSLTPSGSTSLTSPISFGFGGPFQSRGPGKLPASNFTLSLSGLGRSGSLGILSTGTAGYVTLKGTSYALPAATFQKLESSFASVSASGGGSGSSALSKLGIHPLNWLSAPSVVGDETVGGAKVTHIRAGINVEHAARRRQHAARAGVLAGGLGRQRPERWHFGGHPAADREFGAGCASRCLDRRIRPDAPSADPGADRAGHRAGVGAAGRAEERRDLAADAVREPQSAPAGRRAGERPSLHRVPGEAPVLPVNAPGSRAGQHRRRRERCDERRGRGGRGGAARAASSAPATGSATGVQAYSACLQAAGTDVTKMQSCAGLLNGK